MIQVNENFDEFACRCRERLRHRMWSVQPKYPCLMSDKDKCAENVCPRIYRQPELIEVDLEKGKIND